MSHADFDKINQQLSQGFLSLTESQSILKQMKDDTELTHEISSDSSSDPAKILELILQYRLDSQNALMKLLHFDNGLLQIIGIAPLHSSGINLERMQFVLGHDDLQHILHLISQLIQSLMLAAQQLQKKKEKGLVKQVTKTNQPTKLFQYCERLEQAISKQKHFIMTIEELMVDLNEWNKFASIGPIYDHIIALRGPISFYYQAEQNGLELAHDLFDKFHTALKLNLQIAPLLDQSKQILQHLTPLQDTPQFFHLPPLGLPMKQQTPQQLEERANARRLGHYFNH